MTSAAFDSVCSDFPNYYDAILSKAMERLRKSLDAFQIQHVKPFGDMTNTEKCKFLLVRFSIKHMVNKVTNRLNHSKVYKAMLKEQAAKQRSYG